MSWIVTPADTEWPERTPDGVGVGNTTRVTEPEGVPDRRTGCGYDWSDADRAALLGLPGAIEHPAKPADWREADPG